MPLPLSAIRPVNHASHAKRYQAGDQTAKYAIIFDNQARYRQNREAHYQDERDQHRDLPGPGERLHGW